jgi:hypothetical protein
MLVIACIGLGWWVDHHRLTNDTIQASYHWSRLNAYLEHIKNPDNYAADGSVEDPYDVMPSLQMLVLLGEIEHVDLVVPGVTVSPAINRHLDSFVRQHPDIVFLEYNPQYQQFPVTGIQPLHLHVWFRPTGGDDIRQLLKEIESLKPHGRDEQDE